MNVTKGSVRYCGREFDAGEVERIRNIISSDPRLNRHRISKLVCNASLSQTPYESLRFSDLLYFLTGHLQPETFAAGAEAFAKKK